MSGVTEDFDFSTPSRPPSSNVNGDSGSSSGGGGYFWDATTGRIGGMMRDFSDGVVRTLSGAKEEANNVRDDPVMMWTVIWQIVKLLALLLVVYAIVDFVRMLTKRPTLSVWLADQVQRSRKSVVVITTGSDGKKIK